MIGSVAVRRVDIRTLVLILGTALAGAAWAYANLRAAGAERSTAVLTPLVWVIFAIPFFTFWGWLIARPAERWRALAGCLAMYFFTVFIAARIEHLILGREQARLTGHNLYFNAVIICQLLVAVFIALQRAWSPGTKRDSQA